MKTFKELKEKFIKKWSLQTAEGFGQAQFEFRIQCEFDLNELINAAIEERLPSNEKIEEWANIEQEHFKNNTFNFNKMSYLHGINHLINFITKA